MFCQNPFFSFTNTYIVLFLVYAEYAFIGPNLTHERFEMVETPEEADIVWFTWHYKQFKEFSEETPHKRINQFPFEHVLTIKVRKDL